MPAAIFISWKSIRRVRFLWASRGCQRPALCPNLLFLPLHGRASRILHLEPIGQEARAIGRILPLRHNALQAHLAGVGKHRGAVTIDMLVEAQTECRAM
jgi:hypothetical protein